LCWAEDLVIQVRREDRVLFHKMLVFVNFFSFASDVSLVVVIVRKVIVSHTVVLKIVKIIWCGRKALIYALIHFL